MNSNLELIKKVSENVEVVIVYKQLARKIFMQKNKICFSLESSNDYVIFDNLEECLTNCYLNGLMLNEVINSLELITLRTKAGE